jgi:glyoxalase family protein
MSQTEGAVVDVIAERADRGLQAGGTVHHIAFRAPDGATQKRWREQLVEAGVSVTEIIDRQYFTSIYFHEPGGVLLEIATDQPGFTVDEPLLELGRELKLPPWLEPSREQIVAALPRLQLPDHGADDAVGSTGAPA